MVQRVIAVAVRWDSNGKLDCSIIDARASKSPGVFFVPCEPVGQLNSTDVKSYLFTAASTYEFMSNGTSNAASQRLPYWPVAASAAVETFLF
jgi:hypothetical protein